MIHIPRIKSADFRCEGDRVVMLLDGHAVFDVSWEVADQFAQAIRAKARQAEENAKALQIAGDAAVLLRAGVPLGLSNHPRIKAEAVKIARDDRDLRRYMPGGIKSREQFGAPSVAVAQPKGNT